MRAEQVGDDIFRVTNDNETNTYVVDLGAGKCTCTNWAIQRNRLVGAAEKQGRATDQIKYECKHMTYVLRHLGSSMPTTPIPKRDTAAEAKEKRDEIVSRFTTPHIKKKALETLRQAAQLKEGK